MDRVSIFYQQDIVRVGPPTPLQRQAIFRHYLEQCRNDLIGWSTQSNHTTETPPIHEDLLGLTDTEANKLIDQCHGFTGADIAALCRNALSRALLRSSEQHETPRCTLADFKWAKTSIRPTALSRELSVQVPSVSWDEIGGLSEVKVANTHARIK